MLELTTEALIVPQLEKGKLFDVGSLMSVLHQILEQQEVCVIRW